MPNNFRLTGNVYVSKEGSDANSGLTPELPKLTVQAGLNTLTTGQTLVIGAGVYQETITRDYTFLTVNIIADGYVVMEGSGVNSFNSTATNVGTVSFFGIEFRNYFSLNHNNNASTFTCNYTNCVIKSNILAISNQLALIFTSCQFINSVMKFTNGVTSYMANLSYDKCIFINSSQDAWEIASVPGGTSIYNHTQVLKNCYIDSNSLIRLRAQSNYTTGAPIAFQPNTGNIINNNLQGRILFPWAGAVSGFNSFNIPLTLTQAKIDYPTYFFNSFSSAPKFNDPLNLNFTLQSDSPHIRAASDYTNIGGTEYAVYKSATSTEFTSGATISGLTLRGNNSYTITSSPTAGTIETAPISLQWPATKPLTKLEWAGVLEFNKSITAGTFGNNNVPDWDTYTSGAGASPDRLTVRMRYSTQQTQPTTSGQWDNGGYWTAGNYELFEVNSKPKVDSNGKGNGDPTYIESTGLGDIVPTWIQLSIKLIDTYNP
ncbi:MAG: hypothetical protein ACK5DE_12555 [Bacteroidota bacterium]|jgi:hypothetical protein